MKLLNFFSSEAILEPVRKQAVSFPNGLFTSPAKDGCKIRARQDGVINARYVGDAPGQFDLVPVSTGVVLEARIIQIQESGTTATNLLAEW